MLFIQTVDTRHGEENVLLVKGSVVVIEMERMIHRISRDRGDRDSGIREKWGVRFGFRSQSITINSLAAPGCSCPVSVPRPVGVSYPTVFICSVLIM